MTTTNQTEIMTEIAVYFKRPFISSNLSNEPIYELWKGKQLFVLIDFVDMTLTYNPDICETFTSDYYFLNGFALVNKLTLNEGYFK